MHLRLLFASLIIAVTTLNSGCSTLADARAAKGSGTARIFDTSPDAVWKAMPPVIKEVGLDLVGDNRQEGYVLAQRGITPFSYGEHVAIFIEGLATTSKTRVEVVSKKAMATNLLVPNWETEILDALGKKLSMAGIAAPAAVVGIAVPEKSATAYQPSDVRRNNLSVQDVFAVPFIGETGRNGYERFLAAKRRPRVFVLSEKGAWSWKTGPNAVQEALQSCDARGSKCQVYALDNEVVWTPPNSGTNAEKKVD